MSATDKISCVDREHKHKSAAGNTRESLQDLDGLIRKGNRVLDRILRARGRKRPKLGIEVDFLPFHLLNFAKPPTGQDQKFDESGIDRFKCVRGLPDGPELVIG